MTAHQPAVSTNPAVDHTSARFSMFEVCETRLVTVEPMGFSGLPNPGAGSWAGGRV